MADLPSLESTFTDETRLLLYALKSQATHGPTEIKSKWSMTREERGKYETWANLGKMSNFEAMRLYVKLLEEEDKNWWEAIDEETLEIKENYGKAMTEEERMNSNNASACARVKRVAKWAEAMGGGRWETMEATSTSASKMVKPCPRYQHGATLTSDGSKMIVSGGCYRGRFVADTYVFDVAASRWRKMEYTKDEKVWGKSFKEDEKESLTPIGGHRLITLKDGHTYSFGGKFSKTSKRANDTDLAVFRLVLLEGETTDDNVIKGAWIPVHVKGKRGPCARRSMSVTKVGKDGDVVVFGGEDGDRRYLNDCWRLDFKTMSWVACDENTIAVTGTSNNNNSSENKTSSTAVITPAARAEHVAIPWGRDKMIIFGGTGASFKCFDDLYALDISSGKWKAVSASSSSSTTTTTTTTTTSKTPLARAGHCVVSLRNDRYALIIGGGNNQNGVLETAILDLNEVKWITPENDDDVFTKFESPKFVGEGMSAVSFESMDGKESVLMTFGGYNGSCGNDLQVYKLPSEFPNAKRREKKMSSSSAGTATTTTPHVTSSRNEAHHQSSRSSADGEERMAELERLLAQSREEANQIRADARLVVDVHASLQSKLDACERARVDAESLLKSERKIKAQLHDKLERLDRENLRLRERLQDYEGNSKSWF